jgi:hypothetical protein
VVPPCGPVSTDLVNVAKSTVHLEGVTSNMPVIVEVIDE